MKPLVSVLIPCYDAEPWIGDAIRSALAQTWEPLEIIVRDDGSTDGSLDFIRSFGDRIRWETGPNEGANAARNHLIEAGSGEWLQHLDADDLLEPEKIASQMEIAEREGVDFVVAPLVTGDGQVMKAPVDDDPWVNWFHGNLGITGSILMRRETVVAAGGWDAGTTASQEYSLMARMLALGARVAYQEEVLYVYRLVNPNSIVARDVVASYREHVALAVHWARELEKTGELTDRRRLEAALSSFSHARRLWHMSRPDARATARMALEIDPDLMTHMRERWPVYGWVHRLFGFAVAERYDSLWGALRPKWRRTPAASP